MFEHLALPVPDEIVPLMIRASKDTRDQKIDMTVGVYRDDLGQTPIMQAVREADKYLSVHRKSKSYVGPLGDVNFVKGIQALAFTKKIESKFIQGIQTPGGSSALSLILQLVKKARPDMRVWISDPSYANHGPTITAVGLRLAEYPFLNRETMMLQSGSLIETLDSLGPSDAVLLHGSCHNPTGLKLSEHHWQEIARIAREKGFYPIVDTAYQGLGEGLTADAEGLLIMAAQVDNLALSFSCSKNFGLYNDRVGCAFLVSSSEQETILGQHHLASLARPAHWVPPQNGAEIVTHILSTPHLKTLWLEELNSMNQRLKSLRKKLAQALCIETGKGTYDFIAENSGLYSMLPATPGQMETLRTEYAVYGLDNGRINVAGLGMNSISHAAKSIAAVLL